MFASNQGEGWVFRVSSAPRVGGGHVMRCLSIGRELNKHQSVHFLLCNGGEYWFDHVKHYSMTANALHALHQPQVMMQL